MIKTISETSVRSTLYDEERFVRASREILARLARLAAKLLDAPTALVTLIESDRQRFAASVGLCEPFASLGETPLSHSLCQYVVKFDKPLILGDVRSDPMVCDNPAVAELNVASYLGVPLRSRNGTPLGSFCVFDTRTRVWSAEQVALLDDLAQGVMAELTNREIYQTLADTTDSYRDLLDTTTELICAADGDGLITYVNRAWCSAFGYSEDEALGMRAVDLLSPEHRTRYVDVGRRLQQGERIQDFEVVLLGKDQRRVVCRGGAGATHRTNADGSVRCVGTRAVYRNVTQERRAEAGRARLVATLEATSDFVGVSRRDGQMEFINTAGRRLLDIGEDVAVEGLSALQLHPPETLALLGREGMPAALRDGVWRGDGELLHREGYAIPVSMAVIAHPSLEPGELGHSSCIMRDRREKLAAAAALRASEARLALIYQNVSDLLCLMTVERNTQGGVAEYRCESVNEALLAITGRKPASLLGLTLKEFATAENSTRIRTRYDDTVRMARSQSFELEFTGANGRYTLETTLTPVKDAAGVCTHVLSTSRDVTARRAAEAALRESEAAFRAMLQTLRAVAVTLDASGCVTFANEALLSLSGWKREHVIGQDWFTRFVPGASELRPVFERMMEGEEYWPHYDSEIITCSGRIRLIEWDNTVLRDSTGAIMGTASIGHDVTDQRAIQARLAELSERDELTSLLNRRGFVSRVEDALAEPRCQARADALLYIDLDRFKVINDTYGHAAGDEALRDIGRILLSTVREKDFVGRLGGDEFAIYAVDLPEQDGAFVLAQRLDEALVRHNAKAMAHGRPYALEFSIGVTEVSPDHRTCESVLASADAALYEKKRWR